MAARKSPAKKPTKKPAIKAVKQARAPKTKQAARPAPAGPTPRAPGEKRYWLLKTEPEVFSMQDLLSRPNATTHWDGVRNYQARNTLRDLMKQSDGVLIYHSNAEPPAIAGIATVAREGYPDHTQFDSKHDHFDPDAKKDAPTWFMVDVKGIKALQRPLGLPELRTIPGLHSMVLLQKGSRLSVQPVSAAEWDLILQLGGV